jgi:CheY-like chemotaxis protein
MGVTRALPYAGGVAIGYHVAEDAPDVLVGDSLRISQVLFNLMSNAVKFTPQGRIDLVVNTRPDGADRCVVTFAVRDTGVGIPPEFLQRVFEPFEQVPREDSTSRGTGLGLAICRRIAGSLGGSLGVTSTVGAGTEFSFEVPLARGAVQAVAPDPVPAPVPPARLRVLLAEDTPASQLVARMILERLGHEVVAVNDGDDAVRVAQERPFDVVFLDIQMPRMSGFAAARAIRDLGEIGRRLRIVGLSAMAQDADRQRATDVGMDLYLTKPVRLEDVERALAVVTA